MSVAQQNQLNHLRSVLETGRPDGTTSGRPPGSAVLTAVATEPVSPDPVNAEPSDTGTRTGPEPGSLASAVDTVLFRLDGLRDRPALSTALTVIIGVAVAVAWWFGQPDPVGSTVDRIPMAGSAQAPVDGGGEGRRSGSGQDPVGAATPTGPSSGTVSEATGADNQPGDTAGGVDGISGTEPSAARSSSDATGTSVVETIVVHVSGQVVKQGLVHLRPGSRIADAIAESGGPSDEADVHRLNLAAPVVDGMHVRVPAIGVESPEPLVVLGDGRGANETAADPNQPAGSAGSSGLVDINRADAARLETLPGIGPALAQAIVRWRTDNGGFAVIDDLQLVPGIGPAKLAGLQDLVTT